MFVLQILNIKRSGTYSCGPSAAIDDKAMAPTTNEDIDSKLRQAHAAMLAMWIEKASIVSTELDQDLLPWKPDTGILSTLTS